MKYLKYFEDINQNDSEFKEILSYLPNKQHKNFAIVKRWFNFENINVYIRIYSKYINNENNIYLEIADIVEPNEPPGPHDTTKFKKSLEDFIFYIMKIYPYICFETPDLLLTEFILKLGFKKENNDNYYLNLKSPGFEPLSTIRKNYPDLFNELLKIYPNIDTGADMGQLGFT